MARNQMRNPAEMVNGFVQAQHLAQALLDGSGSWNLSNDLTAILRGGSASPAFADQYITKQYADALIGNLLPKNPVRAVAAGNIDVTGATPTSTVGTIALADGDRVLLPNQTDPTENGIYVYSATGSVYTRSIDADNTPNGEFRGGISTLVLEGTNAGSTYTMTSPAGVVTIGVDANTWGVTNQLGDIAAGDGVSVTGTTVSVVMADLIQANAGLNVDVSNNVGVGLNAASSLAIDGTGDITLNLNTNSPIVNAASGLDVTVDGASLVNNAGTLAVGGNGVNETHLDFGSGVNQIDALSLAVSTAGTLYASGATVDAAVKALDTQVDANTSATALNTAGVSTNAGAISTNSTSIGTNSSNISTNTSSIGTNTTNIGTNTSSISTINTTLGTLATEQTTQNTNISTNASAITDLQSGVGNRRVTGEIVNMTINPAGADTGTLAHTPTGHIEVHLNSSFMLGGVSYDYTVVGNTLSFVDGVDPWKLEATDVVSISYNW